MTDMRTYRPFRQKSTLYIQTTRVIFVILTALPSRTPSPPQCQCFFKSWPTIYDAGPALNQHSASSTQSPDFMRLNLRVRLRVRLRRVV